MIRTVFFDLGNVLVHFSEERLRQQIADAFCVEVETLNNPYFLPNIRVRYEKGQISTRAFCDSFYEHLGKSIPDTVFLQALSDIFWENTSISPVVASLKQKGIRLVLLSNVSEAHHDHIAKNFTVLQHFDDLVLSYQVGAMKPEPLIYEAALEKAQCSPQECFFTDDIAAHIEAAREHDIDAEQYTDTPALIGHLKQRGIQLDLY